MEFFLKKFTAEWEALNACVQSKIFWIRALSCMNSLKLHSNPTLTSLLFNGEEFFIYLKKKEYVF